MTEATQRTSDNGVSIWLDDLSRSRIESGSLQDLIANKNVVGVTTNPSIFQKALSQVGPYDAQLKELGKVDVETAVRELTTTDVRNATDIFREIAEATDFVDGRVSIEVDPRLAHDTENTAKQAVELWEKVNRPNAMIKIPATLEGLPAITATVTKFDGMDYRSIASVPSEEDKKLRRVEEGARIPETTVRTQENLVHLHKRGRMLVASYEAIQFQRLDLFSVTLRQIGAYIGRMHLEDAIEVLRNGDGNQNAAQQYTIGTKPITGTKGTLTYDALLEFWSQFDPYTMNTMLVGSDVMLAMLKLDEFQNPLTGLNFQGTGTLTTPLGAKLLRTSAMPAGILIGLDRNYALEQICGSEITVEYDKLIDRQLERAAITSISGFAKLFTEASKVLVV